MRIVIMGTGGVGGYFGGLLAKSGADVTFIARGDHLRAIQEQGLRIESVFGDFTVFPAQATDDPAAVGSWTRSLCHQDTPDRGGRRSDAPHDWAAHGSSAATQRTGRLRAYGRRAGGGAGAGRHLSGGQPDRRTRGHPADDAIPSRGGGRARWPDHARVQRLVEVLRKADIQAEASDNIQRVRWTKFIFIAPYSGVGAVTRVPIGEFRACPAVAALLEQAMREVEAVAAAKGVGLDPDVVAKTLAFCDGVEPKMMASMQRDVLDGKPSELDSLVGVMVRFGAELGVPVPTFRFLHGALLPQEERVRRIPPA